MLHTFDAKKQLTHAQCESIVAWLSYFLKYFFLQIGLLMSSYENIFFIFKIFHKKFT